MALASYADANHWLDGEKLQFISEDDALPEATEIDRLIRSTLFDAFGTLVTDWDFDGTPESVPAAVRGVAGRLMAAMRYRKVYSLEDLPTDSYATFLERGGMEALEGIRSGMVALDDVTYISGIQWSEGDFWPNDTTVKPGTTESDRKFTMSMEF